MRTHISSNVEEHSTYTIEEAADFVINCKSPAIIARNLKILKARIIELTSFLDESYAGTRMIEKKTGLVPMGVRYEFLRKGIFSREQIPNCTICHTNPVSLYESTLREHCNDKKCLNEYRNNERAKTNLERYGVETTLLVEETKEKIKQTNLERYGTEHAMQSDVVKAKTAKTNEERYGHRVPNIGMRLSGEIDTPFPFQDPKVIEKIKETNMERHGVEMPYQSAEIRAKSKETVKERYGVDNVFQVPEINAKKDATFLKKYGGHPMSNPEQRRKSVLAMYYKTGFINAMDNPDNVKKAQATNLERYGVTSPAMNPTIKEKMNTTLIEKYGDHPKRLHYTEETKDVLSNPVELERLYKIHGSVKLPEVLGVCYETVYKKLKEYNIDLTFFTGSSAVENRLASFIESILPPHDDTSHPSNPTQPRVIRNDRTLLNGKELDVYIPELNLAIEMNGIYWHSTKFKDKDHMREKQAMCAARGVRLIHIYDDEYNDREIQFNRKLMRLMGIRDEERVYARKTEVVQLTNKQVKAFYDEFHIQGHMNAGTVYGLVIKGTEELVAAMSFKVQYGSMELTRFATSCNVVGGFTKLIKAFLVDNPGVNQLVSFADRRYSDGHVYESNGWILDKITVPSYAYVVDGVRQHKAKFRRKYLREFLGDNFDPDKTEVQNMIDNDYPQIFDCGLNRYVLNRSTVLGN